MFILNETNSIANNMIAELRDVDVQQDRMRFRRNLERLGMILAYEISKTLPFATKTLQTPLAEKEVSVLAEQPVLITIMRAGLPFYQGFLNVFDKAENGFIGAFRGDYAADNSFQVEMGYLASPSLDNKQVILIDPMLATGKSLVEAYDGLIQRYGKPQKLHVVAAVASQPGVEYVAKSIEGASLWVGALDEKLNQKSYIVPGLGDAGDLSFGTKV